MSTHIQKMKSLGERAKKMVVVILYVTDHHQQYGLRAHSQPKKGATSAARGNPSSENTMWAELSHEQYSRDAAIEDEIITRLEQLYGKRHTLNDSQN